MNEKKLVLLHKQYEILIRKMKSAKSDKQFEKALGAFKIVKDEIIACENRNCES